MITCKNCQNLFRGIYCNSCGEKVVENKDFTLKHIFNQALDSFTNIDSKLLSSLRLLTFHPGKLSLFYIEGLRVPFMKPFQIFLIANVVFFLFLSETDLFRTPSQWFFNDNFENIDVLKKAQSLAIEKQVDIDSIAVLYDKKSSDLSKGFIFLIIPFISFIGYLLNRKTKYELGKHIIFSTHFFSFLLLLCVAVNQLIKLIDVQINKWFFILPIILLMSLHYIVGIHIFYKNNWISSVVKGIISIFFINLTILLYRFGVSLISLYTL